MGTLIFHLFLLQKAGTPLYEKKDNRFPASWHSFSNSGSFIERPKHWLTYFIRKKAASDDPPPNPAPIGITLCK